MRTLALYVGLCIWVALAQGLFPIYNTLLDLALLVAALIPAFIMLARRRLGQTLLTLGITLSGAALVHRFAGRLLGLLRWDGHGAVGPLCLAHFTAFVLGMLFTFAVFTRRGFQVRVASAVLFGFLLILGAGITAPDFMVDAQLKYAIGSAISARRGLERIILTFSNVPGRPLDDAVRESLRVGLLGLPRFQLKSLSERFFDSRFADDTRLVADLLLGPNPRDEALIGLEPLLLSRRLEFEVEDWTALRLAEWPQLFRSQGLWREMLFGLAKRRVREGKLADAEAALNALITSGNGSDGAKALAMVFKIYDTILGDIEGGLTSMERVLQAAPEYAFLPAARDAFGRLDEDTRRRLKLIASTQGDAQVRALAHLRLFFSARRSSNELIAWRHLDEVMRLASGELARLELGLRLYQRAKKVGAAASLRFIRASVELCDGLEPPFLLLASQLNVPDELSDLPEIALRRLVTLHEESIFWHDGLARLVALLRRQGRRQEANELLITHSEHLDLLSADVLVRGAVGAARGGWAIRGCPISRFLTKTPRDGVMACITCSGGPCVCPTYRWA